MHCGTKPSHFETPNHLLSHKRGSERSERASEQVSTAKGASEAVRSKQTSERCERTSEQTSEWLSTAVWVHGCSGPQCSGSVNQIRIGRYGIPICLRSGANRSFLFRFLAFQSRQRIGESWMEIIHRLLLVVFVFWLPKGCCCLFLLFSGCRKHLLCFARFFSN